MEIKDYKSGDEAAIVQLFELVFHKPMTLEYWDWRFRKNPVNKFMIKLMWDQDKLVGHYAVSPVTIVHQQQTMLTGLSMTTMTHPEYTGLGIFQQLAEGLYHDTSSRDHIVAIWGFPNNNSHRGFIKNLGWKDITVLPMMTGNASLIKAKEWPEMRKIERFTDAHANIYAAIFSNYTLKVKKDAAYLNWRYVDNPSNTYAIFDITEGKDGFVVCKEYSTGSNGGKQMDIIDWCVPDNEKLTRNVLQHLSFLYPSEKYSQYNLWMPLHDERHLHFEKLGFTNAAPVTYWGIRSFIENDLKDKDEWWIQLGDSDVY